MDNTRGRMNWHARANGRRWLAVLVMAVIWGLIGWAGVGKAAGAGAQLTLNVSADTVGPIVWGQVYAYELCYGNGGDQPATGAMLEDVLPYYVDYQTGTATGGAIYDAATRSLRWPLGDLAAGAESCVSFSVKVTQYRPPLAQRLPDRQQSELSVINQATIGASNAPTVQIEQQLILSSITNPTITKAVAVAEVIATEPVTFTLSIANVGNAPATDVTVSDALSSYFEQPSVTTTRGVARYDGPTHSILADLGTLAPAETAQLTIYGYIRNLNPGDVPVSFNNMALLDFDEGNPRESNRVQVAIIGTPPPREIPEPTTIVLLGAGLAGLAGWYGRRRLRSHPR